MQSVNVSGSDQMREPTCCESTRFENKMKSFQSLLSVLELLGISLVPSKCLFFRFWLNWLNWLNWSCQVSHYSLQPLLCCRKSFIYCLHRIKNSKCQAGTQQHPANHFFFRAPTIDWNHRLALLPVTCDSVSPIATCWQVKHMNFSFFRLLHKKNTT